LAYCGTFSMLKRSGIKKKNYVSILYILVIQTSKFTQIAKVLFIDRAVAQAVSRWLPTEAARVQTRV
jgi:hypothetical protein